MMRHLPNVLTVLRLMLIPAYLLLFFLCSPVAALPAFLAAGMTDVLDGYLARRLSATSAFGRALDPVADKLMQGAVLISLAIGDFLPWLLLLPFFAKELAQGVCGFLMLRRRRVAVVSRWYGKAAISVFYTVVTLTVLLMELLPTTAALTAVIAVLWALCVGMMLFAFISYIVSYARMAAKIKKEWSVNAPVGED